MAARQALGNTTDRMLYNMSVYSPASRKVRDDYMWNALHYIYVIDSTICRESRL